MTLRKGRIRIHHFAHKPDSACLWGVGETEEHRRVKLAIYRGLIDVGHAEDVSLERGFGSCRPDVYALIRGEGVAIEVQRSALSVDEMARRTAVLRDEGMAVLWIVPKPRSEIRQVSFDRPELGTEERLAPRPYERWLHALYFGRVYYWVGGLELQPVHFSDYWLYKDEGYDQEGDFHDASTYRSRRWVSPMRGRVCSIGRDFEGQARRAWSGGRLTPVPRCAIYIDRQERWWSTKNNGG